MAKQSRGAESIATEIQGALTKRFGASAFTVQRTEAVGPKVGGELKQKAIYAILISFLATLIYLALRFEWRFGVAAVIATAHDILATLAFIKYAHLEISLVVVGGDPDDDRLFAERHDHHLRSRAREPAPAAEGLALRHAQPLGERDAAALGTDARHRLRDACSR